MTKLQRGQYLRVTESGGMTVTAHSGTVWITEQASERDVLLQPGQSFMFTRPGLALLEAFSDDVLMSFDA